MRRVFARFNFKLFRNHNLDDDEAVLFRFVRSCHLRARAGIYPTTDENFFREIDFVDHSVAAMNYMSVRMSDCSC